MKIKFYNPADLDKNLKITVHKTGKMGFTLDAAKKLDLSTGKSANIGSNEEDENDNNLYLLVYPHEKGSFKVSKAGDYYYINTKVLFDNLKIDYVKENVVYDISEIEIEGNLFYKLKRRENRKKEKDSEN